MASQPASHLQLASQQAIWKNVNLTLGQILGVSIFDINTQVTFFRRQASQPTAIGQSTSHLTKYQPNPKNQILGEGQVNILLDGQSANQPASQLQFASHLTNCQPGPKSDLGGCPSFTSIHKWHFVRWPTSCNWPANQPSDLLSTWPEVLPYVNLTWSLIWGVHLTKCQPDLKSRQVSTWPKASLGGTSDQSKVWPNVNLIQSLILGGTTDQMSTWPEVWPNVNQTRSLILGGTSDFFNTLRSFALASQRSFLTKDQ